MTGGKFFRLSLRPSDAPYPALQYFLPKGPSKAIVHSPELRPNIWRVIGCKEEDELPDASYGAWGHYNDASAEPHKGARQELGFELRRRNVKDGLPNIDSDYLMTM